MSSSRFVSCLTQVGIVWETMIAATTVGVLVESAIAWRVGMARAAPNLHVGIIVPGMGSAGTTNAFVKKTGMAPLAQKQGAKMIVPTMASVAMACASATSDLWGWIAQPHHVQMAVLVMEVAVMAFVNAVLIGLE